VGIKKKIIDTFKCSEYHRSMSSDQVCDCLLERIGFNRHKLQLCITSSSSLRPQANITYTWDLVLYALELQQYSTVGV
jgi:hypothetical protein